MKFLILFLAISALFIFLFGVYVWLQQRLFWNNPFVRNFPMGSDRFLITCSGWLLLFDIVLILLSL